MFEGKKLKYSSYDSVKYCLYGYKQFLACANKLYKRHGSCKMLKDAIYKISNHTCLIIVYNHPTSLRQDQSVAIATTNFVYTNKLYKVI